MTGPSVLACGLTTLDLLQTVDRVPGPDEKVVAHGLLVSSGGPAANAAVTATALGRPARLLSRIGTGSVGRIAAEDLAGLGVEVVDLGGPGTSPAVSTILVTRSTGQRAVVSVNATLPGQAPDRGSAVVGVAGTELLDQLLHGVRAVLVDGHHLDLAVPVAAAARARGLLVLLDGGSWKPGLERLLAHVDVAVLSADFALPGRSAATTSLAEVATLGPAAVARSHGPDPIELSFGDATARVRVPRVEVVDTLGAGDVLHGALLAWLAGHVPLSAGQELDRLAAGLAASAVVAAESCAAPGARGWLDVPAAVSRLIGVVAG